MWRRCDLRLYSGVARNPCGTGVIKYQQMSLWFVASELAQQLGDGLIPALRYMHPYSHPTEAEAHYYSQNVTGRPADSQNPEGA